jgi:hypothetical protein
MNSQSPRASQSAVSSLSSHWPCQQAVFLRSVGWITGASGDAFDRDRPDRDVCQHADDGRLKGHEGPRSSPALRLSVAGISFVNGCQGGSIVIRSEQPPKGKWRGNAE